MEPGISAEDCLYADLRLQTTLVFPPARPMQRNQRMLNRLAELDRKSTVVAATFNQPRKKNVSGNQVS
jgi:hypothetical protein